MTRSPERAVLAKSLFAEILTPALALVAPVGMGGSDRTTWLAAAWRALDGIPVDLLREGCRAAMLTADHPSKIVPAIIAEVGDRWKGRCETARAARPQPERIEHRTDRCTPPEAAAILKRAGVGRFSRHAPAQPERVLRADPERPGRVPTRADYLALGVAADVLDGMGMG